MYVYMCMLYCAFKFNLQCCSTQTSFRREIFNDFPGNLVKIEAISVEILHHELMSVLYSTVDYILEHNMCT